MRLTVLTAARSQRIGEGLTYDPGHHRVSIGSAVRVPLRRRTVEGIVLAVEEEKAAETFAVREIANVLGNAPLLPAHLVRLIVWMAKTYCCTPRQAASAVLPGAPWSALLPQPQTLYRLRDCRALVRGSRQIRVIDALASGGWLEQSELRALSGAPLATLRALASRGILECKVQDTAVETGTASAPQVEDPDLTEAQAAALRMLRASGKPSLLFGVTGSGKTEVYAALIADAVRAGKQAIVLLPEILLSEYAIHRFQRLLPPQRIAVLHSRMRPGERRSVWKRCRSGEVQLIIGTRSALFAPLPSPGVIIVDEEHEWTYKSDRAPRYHARETAEYLARLTGARLVLGSATPSLESWERAKRGAYALVRLQERFRNAPLPAVRVVDLGQVSFGDAYPFSPPLLHAIAERLRKGEQTVLFLNRRGLATALLCLECRRRVISPASQLPFTVHRRGGTFQLMDHATGIVAPVPAACPACGSVRLRMVGAGTQRIEHVLATHFPQARLLRADADTLVDREQMRAILNRMREGRADILLGTQSVVKGLDLPQVTLAGVLLADIGLSLPHFRAGERVFQLLTQLTGRSGRHRPGEVIIQTFRPDAPEIRCAAQHAVEEFLEQELRLRAHAQYPPCVRMIRLILRGAQAQQRATSLAASIRSASPETTVTAGPTFHGAGAVWQVLLKGPDPLSALPGIPTGDVVVDVDPLECL